MEAADTRRILRDTAAGGLPSLHLGCPFCGQSYIFPVSRDSASEPAGGEAPAERRELVCEGCGGTIPFRGPPADASRPVEACAVCGCEEFYVQKDFNRNLGLWVVVGSGLVAFLVMLMAGHIWGILVLFAVTLVDWVVYRCLRDVTVCYLCNTIYRGFPQCADHRAFYLGSEEKYKALRQEWMKELRE